MAPDRERLLLSASRLERVDDRVWRAAGEARVSYPEEGNAACYEVEEGSFWFRHRSRSIVELMRRFPPPGPVLDVGGGNGFVTRALEAAGFPAVLLEPGAAGVENARARGLSPIIHSTLEGAGFRAGSLPALGFFDVLEHLERDADALRLAASILEPGGRIYLTVPAFGWLWSAEDDHAGHFRRYTVPRLAGALRDAGFAVEHATYLFQVLAAPIFLARSLPSRLGLRRTGGDPGVTRREHTLPPGPVGAVIQRSLDREHRRLSAGGRIAFGSSCLVVGRKG